MASMSSPQFKNRGHFTKVEFTWTGKIELGPVRNQKKCTCCWAITATDAIQSEYNKNHPQDTIQLAAQELVDCYKHKYSDKSHLDEDPVTGCYTNNLVEGFKYVKEFGVMEEKHYMFEAAKNEECKAAEIDARRFKIEDFEVVSATDERDILAAIQEQPIVGGFELPRVYFSKLNKHREGVFLGPEPSHGLEYGQEGVGKHAVLIVGYGDEGGVNYYFVKNSYGYKWGVQGYGKIARDIFSHFIRPVRPYLIE